MHGYLSNKRGQNASAGFGGRNQPMRFLPPRGTLIADEFHFVPFVNRFVCWFITFSSYARHFSFGDANPCQLIKTIENKGGF
jgi:hypothetical protein